MARDPGHRPVTLAYDNRLPHNRHMVHDPGSRRAAEAVGPQGAQDLRLRAGLHRVRGKLDGLRVPRARGEIDLAGEHVCGTEGVCVLFGEVILNDSVGVRSVGRGFGGVRFQTFSARRSVGPSVCRERA